MPVIQTKTPREERELLAAPVYRCACGSEWWVVAHEWTFPICPENDGVAAERKRGEDVTPLVARDRHHVFCAACRAPWTGAKP